MCRHNWRTMPRVLVRTAAVPPSLGRGGLGRVGTLRQRTSDRRRGTYVASTRGCGGCCLATDAATTAPFYRIRPRSCALPFCCGGAFSSITTISSVQTSRRSSDRVTSSSAFTSPITFSSRLVSSSSELNWTGSHRCTVQFSSDEDEMR